MKLHKARTVTAIYLYNETENSITAFKITKQHYCA